jgi:hypothetical protein
LQQIRLSGASTGAIAVREAHYGEQNPLELNFMPVMDEDQPAKTVLEQERERLRRTKPKLSDDEKVAALVEYAMHLDGGEVEQLYLEAFSDGIPADFLGPISPAERELERKRKERVAILEARSGRFDELGRVCKLPLRCDGPALVQLSELI